MRASILLEADDGMVDVEIAEELEIALATVERVRKRCIERGLQACLEREPQDNPSRPRKLDGASEAHLVRLACSDPPTGRGRWTLSLLAGKLVELKIFDSVSKSTVQRGPIKNELEPWQVKRFCIPPEENAAFVQSMEDVLDVYHEHSPLWSR